ncbi:TPA: hypothetical protein QDB40_004619 [Burkholderia vietnamiensis]|jgi:hypothetical protein|uniref:Uncharacterized protein n=1 Tax=Burkholderia vietnamiensis (strain G4 / LMG 22486) TaxID=269482 RepID=A4JDI3_BURVG|nr:hypothetical protein [Burkholderia vietnamiensis]ABO54336.1 hypothetical protein Bcep1808_1326 [Burkholderia vietnamiensis G4]KVE13191.1 hypothetical protein WI92_14675 [Burkholderia vietnamiensis]KVS12901.1 hypothetical protein WK32_32290 [Burkholderia vietnamiensis]KVS43791.1 hypothetical protein WK35_23545 [Burkholderia vietnamiensis]MCB4347464.1 hypothetical protein [Burkholderia vietnamiensis]
MIDHHLTPEANAAADAGRAIQFIARVSAASFVALLAGLLIPSSWIELATWTVAVVCAALTTLALAALAVVKGGKHG